MSYRRSIGYGAYGYIPPQIGIAIDSATAKAREAQDSHAQRKAYNTAIRKNNKQAAVEACTKLSDYDCPIQIIYDAGNPPFCTRLSLEKRKANCEMKVSSILNRFSKSVSDAIKQYEEAIKVGKSGAYVTKSCISAFTSYNCPATGHCFDEGKEKCGYQAKGRIRPGADHKTVVKEIRDAMAKRNIIDLTSEQYEWTLVEILGHTCLGQRSDDYCGPRPKEELSPLVTWQCCPVAKDRRKPSITPITPITPTSRARKLFGLPIKHLLIGVAGLLAIAALVSR